MRACLLCDEMDYDTSIHEFVSGDGTRAGFAAMDWFAHLCGFRVQVIPWIDHDEKLP